MESPKRMVLMHNVYLPADWRKAEFVLSIFIIEGGIITTIWCVIWEFAVVCATNQRQH